MRPAIGRRLIVALAVVCLLVARPQAEQIQAPGGAPAGERRLSRLDRLEQWTTAIERHAPGRADEALETFAGWSADDLRDLTLTVHSALSLLRDPSTRVFSRPRPERPSLRQPAQVFYSGAEVRRLLDVSRRFAAIGEMELLRRAALLHMDVVVLGSGTDATSGRRARSSYVLLQFSDGQQLGAVDAIGHWDAGRFMLNQVWPDKQRHIRPTPDLDDWVRRWYRAAALFMIDAMQLHTGIVSRAVELFPNDAEINFVAGAVHEALAAPAVQEPLRAVKLPPDVDLGVLSARGELGQAENLLERALKAQPTHLEARVRLGNVLGRQGKHKDALAVLRRVPAGHEGLLAYYAQLFIGRSSAALGDAVGAKAAFDAAATLAPAAQSPLLALSQLAQSRGDLDGAAESLARVLALREGDMRDGDPWWTYSASAGRRFDEAKADLIARLREPLPR
jgi:hypothetical protein